MKGSREAVRYGLLCVRGEKKAGDESPVSQGWLIALLTSCEGRATVHVNSCSNVKINMNSPNMNF